jgi:hypothetical protein
MATKTGAVFRAFAPKLMNRLRPFDYLKKFATTTPTMARPMLVLQPVKMYDTADGALNAGRLCGG